MRKFLARSMTVAVLATFALPGCDQELVLVTDVYDQPLSTRSLRNYVAETGGFGLVVVNGPISPSKAEVERALAAKIGVTGRPDIKITPTEDRPDANRIVLVFNPLQGGRMSPERLCSGNIGRVEQQLDPGAMRIYGVVCTSERVVSHAMTLSYDIPPTDPRFRDVANALSFALFPPHPRGDRADCAFC